MRKKIKEKKKVSETTYSIRAIPIGGYVQLAGEGLEEDKKVNSTIEANNGNQE